MTSVRFVAISDTHGRHRDLDIPSGDVLVHAGDFTRKGSRDEVDDFGTWLDEVANRFQHVLIVPGNHDLCLDTDETDAVRVGNRAQVLLGESVTVLGIRVFGSPIQPQLGRKYIAFARSGEEVAATWEKVPIETDVLISHAPPQGFGDRMWGLISAGSPAVLAACHRVQPSHIVFGHIHAGYGISQMLHESGAETVCINAASKAMFGMNPPIVFDVVPRQGEALANSY